MGGIASYLRIVARVFKNDPADAVFLWLRHRKVTISSKSSLSQWYVPRYYYTLEEDVVGLIHVGEWK